MDLRNIVVHCVGGAGISIADKNFKFLTDTDSEYKAKLIFNCIDTSESNFIHTKHLKDETKLVKISNVNLSQGFLDGSGGVRGHATASIVKGIQEYLDNKKYLSPKKGEIHVIIASASGGSGNMLAATLYNNLMLKEVPTLLVLIGDSSTAKTAENTRKTLLTINSMANKFNRVTSLRYLLNNYSEFPSVREAQADNDAQIGIILDFLRIFNGDIKDLDYQDLVNLLNPKTADFDIPIGVYSFIARIGVSDSTNLHQDLIPVINRTIIQNPEAYKPLNIMHSKIGYIENPELKENVEKIHDKSNLTLSLVVGGLQEEVNRLEEIEVNIKKDLERAKAAIKINNDLVADDDGFIV